MLNADSPLAGLLRAPVRPGVIRWIGLRPGRRAPLTPVNTAELDLAEGLVGDHYQSRGRRTRQLTLIQGEDLDAIASFLGLSLVLPEQLRRNVVVSGINLLGLPGSRLRMGEAVVEVTGQCHPCSRMEEAFGVGGYNAVRSHGGITARIVQGGKMSVGDPVIADPAAEGSTPPGERED